MQIQIPRPRPGERGEMPAGTSESTATVQIRGLGSAAHCNPREITNGGARVPPRYSGVHGLGRVQSSDISPGAHDGQPRWKPTYWESTIVRKVSIERQSVPEREPTPRGPGPEGRTVSALRPQPPHPCHYHSQAGPQEGESMRMCRYSHSLPKTHVYYVSSEAQF